jgi:hypothetical protein
MEHEMSLFSTSIADRLRLPLSRSAEDPSTPLTESSLPRHLLVALAGITTNVTSLQQHCVDDPYLHTSLESILCRLDDLVGGIYERAADPAPRCAHRAGPAAGSLSDALAAEPVAVTDATQPTGSLAGVDQTLPGRPS